MTFYHDAHRKLDEVMAEMQADAHDRLNKYFDRLKSDDMWLISNVYDVSDFFTSPALPARAALFHAMKDKEDTLLKEYGHKIFMMERMFEK